MTGHKRPKPVALPPEPDLALLESCIIALKYLFLICLLSILVQLLYSSVGPLLSSLSIQAELQITRKIAKNT